MTIVEQLFVGRVWQEERGRNGCDFWSRRGTDPALLSRFRMTYTTRPSQDLKLCREEPQNGAETESLIRIQSRSFRSELQSIVYLLHLCALDKEFNWFSKFPIPSFFLVIKKKMT
uniref:Uncharacterized protein n=1 Tax=Heterorhabditis bacteriophora TaxID=37862 RepID=A0A1I7WG13_HETBA